ncbi:hypothetical protein [Aliishimia ponticola]|nr:hypothetical protein [Aliishimia ponticola]
MTNTAALVLALFIVGAAALDVWYFGNEHMIFLSKKFLELLDWLAFWR